MTDIASVVLLAAILIVLIETRITVGTKVAVMANELDWIRQSLVKWGMIPPRDSQGNARV